MPQVALTTLGCKVNQFETEVMEGLFKAQGYEVVNFNQYADIYVINTCSVTSLGEKKSRQLIRRANRQNPSAVIAVAGCYSQISPDKVSQIPGVDVIVGTQDRSRIVELVEAVVANNHAAQVNVVADIMHAKEFEDIPLLSMPGRTRAFLKIQEGCTNFCSYCIIPYARGPLRSRSLASIAAETKKLVTAGFNEIVLTGIHLGAFGCDLSVNSSDITLADAVETVLAAGGKELMRLRLGSLESIELSDRLIFLIKTDKRFCHHLHLPLQAGHDQILKSMNRHYTTAQYHDLITHIKKQVPGIAITTDIIVGFPGETDAIFESSLSYISTLGLANIHVFPYSRRTGTPAAGFPDQIPEITKKERVQQLRQVAATQSKAFYQPFLSQPMDVLFDTVETDEIISGLTGNYARVYAKGLHNSIGKIVTVTLDHFYQDGLWGTTTEEIS